jgi:anti-sigma B factor antagonist
MADGRELHLTLESKLESVDAVELIVQQLAEDSGFGQEQIEHLGLAVRESMINAVVHGNGYSSEKQVHLTVVVDPGRIAVTIRDQGEGFDPGKVPDPLSKDNLLRESGRGLLLIRAFVDELQIRPASPHGTELQLVKYSSRSESHQDQKEEEMSLSASIREVDGVSIVDLSGRITLGEASGKLRETVRGLLGSGKKRILLNLGDVTYIDSSGLGELVSSYTTAANQGAKVKLLNVQKKVHDLLQITKLYTVFESHDEETDAVLSFS